MGNTSSLTSESIEIIENADVIIGAERMTEYIDINKNIYNSYKPDEILEYIKGKDFNTVVILLSGDVGFYSGAKRLIDTLKEYEVKLIPGISSVVYFCSALKMPWDDVKLLSIHGKRKNIIGYIKKYKKVFTLLSGKKDIEMLCEKLCYYGLGDVILNIGERLSYEDEKITRIKAKYIKKFDFKSLLVILAENPDAYDMSYKCIDDCDFIRGNIPMTKSEIRSLSIAKLGLSESSILYDIGAGTGSVSVEASIKSIDGEVYAIEQNKDAIELIERNKRKFAADNIIVVDGKAPDILKNLPVPTHIFIGGSKGGIEKIIKCCFEKNSDVKIVINAITLNTVGKIMDVIKKENYKTEIVCVNIAKNKSVGEYELMTGYNPVYIFIVNQLKN